MNKYIAGALCVLGVLFFLQWKAQADEKKEDLICTKNEELQKILHDKGYEILLNMTNSDGVIQTLWVAGQSALITAAVPKQDNSCLLVTMKDVTYAPYTIESIWENYKKQTKQKDI